MQGFPLLGAYGSMEDALKASPVTALVWHGGLKDNSLHDSYISQNPLYRILVAINASLVWVNRT
jgi:hypothetical protein